MVKQPIKRIRSSHHIEMISSILKTGRLDSSRVGVEIEMSRPNE